ncbi:HTTM domain-containing protein [Anatilimnocola floriformis]|uniref:HTTM domain-containing protein n=1 Tax=Anatilimnocola floriformis TaxID=2948575 RepID=UPI0020C469CE|nr:HTTM domain-containing protein [Anatilimnocola floriformis]
MNALVAAVLNWFVGVWTAWNRFWFQPALPHTMAVLRIFGGGMLLYTQLIWTINQGMFLGRDSWLNAQTALLLNTSSDGQRYAWSYLYYVDSPWLLSLLNVGALIAFGMLVAGWHTRIVSILSMIITLAYCHRLTGALYGLDQINAVIATYLAVANCGGVYSVDHWLAKRRGLGEIFPTVDTNIATRLLQLHMCVIYLFGGIGKARGELWWDGSACWFALACKEYQNFDLTWLVRYPWFLATLTHITVFWEMFYCFFVWPKLTRPICLGLAAAVHLGIALFLGMPTFGLMMLFGNLAFVYPETVAAVVGLKWLRGEVKEPVVATLVNDSPVRKAKSVSETTIEPQERMRIVAR